MRRRLTWWISGSTLVKFVALLRPAMMAHVGDRTVPFFLPDSEKRSPVASKALLLCGFIAARQHSLLSTRLAFSSSPTVRAILIILSSQSTLNIISKSVMIYLHEDDMSCKALAIDLCSRGFSIWQHYVDSMEMLRSLFSLATSTKKESISAQNVGPQARQAVLHVVTTDTGIFMTTLSLDILHPHNLEHRKSVMQLVAFLIRKVGLFFSFHSLSQIFLIPSPSLSKETSCHTSQSSKTDGSGSEVPGPQFNISPRRRS